MGFTGYVCAVLELAVLVLLVLVYRRLRALPGRILRMVETARAQGAEEAAARLAARVAQVSGDGAGLLVQLRAVLEEQDERNRAERAAAEVRARIAARRPVSATPAEVATTDDDDEVTRHRSDGPLLRVGPDDPTPASGTPVARLAPSTSVPMSMREAGG